MAEDRFPWKKRQRNAAFAYLAWTAVGATVSYFQFDGDYMLACVIAGAAVGSILQAMRPWVFSSRSFIGASTTMVCGTRISSCTSST